MFCHFLFIVHTHLFLFLFGWLISGDLVVFLSHTGFLFFLLRRVSLQQVVHKLFKRVQVSFSSELVRLQNDTQKWNNLLATTGIIFFETLRLLGWVYLSRRISDIFTSFISLIQTKYYAFPETQQ